jgi:hypothetical protein
MARAVWMEQMMRNANLKQEANMQRPLAIAIGLALCLLGSSSAYAGKGSALVKEASWAWTYLKEGWDGWHYKNGKFILKEPIKFGRYERDEIDLKDLKPGWGTFVWGPLWAAGTQWWNSGQKEQK